MREHILSIIVLLAGMAATLFGVGAGVWMMISPLTFSRWQYKRLWEASESDPTIKPRRSHDLEARVAGGILSIASLFFLSLLTVALWQGATIAPVQPHRIAAQVPRFDWPMLIIGLALTSGGIYSLMKPDVVARWHTRMVVSRRLRDDAMPRASRSVRGFGLAFFLVGLVTLYWWARLAWRGI